MPRRKDNPNIPPGAIFAERVLAKLRGKDWILTSLNPRRRKKSSPAQKEGQNKFKWAVKKAKSLLKDPKKKKAYDRHPKGHRNGFQRAVAEFMRKSE